MAMKGLHMKAVSVHVAVERAIAAVPAEIILSCSIVDLQHVLVSTSLLQLESLVAFGKPQIGCSGGVGSGQVVAG